MSSITIVACAKSKNNQPSYAKELYKSLWFIKARAYVEQQKWDWYIISAKYGLLHTDKLIEPYELTLNNMKATERRQWSEKVFKEILQVLPEKGTVRFFAGKKYREYLVPLLQEVGYTVEIPLRGLGIGQQLAWFSNSTSN
ncbi:MULTISPECIES: DUF6884 domain-containing protein [Nostoc]|jgi:cytoplasmic iron level regulating protein YaaA (DUF328/UPF0246 family)|uniref:DUF6884 domain-containing protein n=2 Tax=Nostoc TaxID=1177 RepID=A0ABR8IL50_9NOSO|nr:MULTISPECIES: DUF6884 domain-containing protein [Nostoc]MBD2560709.1 hypothetical protein [Nostoc linckia FACHB-391]MBD2651225.1 hypothetical protein [Nostoc foliaceum FACHB-393]